METLSEHRVELEIAMPAPRRTRLPLRVTALLAVAILLLGVFAAGSSRALWEAVKLSWLAGAGHTTAARIIQIQTDPADVKGQAPQQVALRYACDLPGPQGLLHREGWIGLGEKPPLGNGPTSRKHVPDPPAFQLNQTLPIRYVSWFGGIFSQPWAPGAGGRILTLFFSGGLVLLVSLLLARRLLRWMAERLHLLRQGTATVGTITHKRTEAEDMVRYFLRYGYSVGQGEGREHEEQVSMDQWKLFQVGQPVTVLYDPGQPERVGLYALIRH